MKASFIFETAKINIEPVTMGGFVCHLTALGAEEQLANA